MNGCEIEGEEEIDLLGLIEATSLKPSTPAEDRASELGGSEEKIHLDETVKVVERVGWGS